MTIIGASILVLLNLRWIYICKQTIRSSRIITFYVLIINILTAVSLPFFFFYIVTYVTVDYTNNLLNLTDTVDMAILFKAVYYHAIPEKWLALEY